MRYKISYFKVFNYKTYTLIKEPHALAKTKKLKLKVFISYLISYNSINNFYIWNLNNDEIKSYRDIIFSKNKFFNIYKRTKLIKKAKKNIINILVPEPYISEINSEDKEFLNTSVHNRQLLL